MRKMLTCDDSFLVPAMIFITFLLTIIIVRTPTNGQTTSQPATPNTNEAAQSDARKTSSKNKPTRSVIYKQIDDRQLRLDIFEPADLKAGDSRPCFFSIHGGGWGGGDPVSMYRFTRHAAALGMVGISVQYRLYKPGTKNTVFTCVQDVRSAVRYVRQHARELGIDPNKIIVNGASAGGHLAVATALFDFNEPGEDTITSCEPNALILFSPCIDTSTSGYGTARIGKRWRELSPAHNVRPNMPPTLLFHGTGDKTTPFEGAKLFHEEMLKAGNRCDFVVVENGIHTYMFKDAALYASTLERMDQFLASLGYIASPPSSH